MVAQVREFVPDCVGLSLAYRQHDVTFTLVASDEITAALDALQYLDDGPCVTAVDEARTIALSEGDLLDEGRWQLFARGTEAAASRARSPSRSWSTGPWWARSTSTQARPTHSMASTGRSHGCSARGPREPSSMRTLDFTTRRAAEDAPRLLFEATRIQVAVGILASLQDVSPAVARERLREAARRAGVSEAAVARLVIEQATAPRSNRSRDDARRDDGRDDQ